ncbi:hypothetical protein PILCRDRAFT_6567 [Piloderma croceum F 1598]|uniref:NTF2 domain-containing protein n=1 Tax=Piloderma croceum (strain F 1598) TaxID=765440 RepID=A0A0C3FXP9_PILCF|nr:hypothetical protein PILCRDRAFT_6567 [Piloderma croceum F 1598]
MDASGSSFKRRKIVSGQTSPSSTFQQNVQIKQETPDPPPLPQRRVVTSGSRRYLIPTDCEKGQPNFKHHRQAWSQKEADELRRRGFKPVRMFIREDGMVIDWYVSLCGKVWHELELHHRESSAPVWSDTLEPAGTDLASVIQRAHAVNNQSNGNSRKGASPNSRSGKPVSVPGMTPLNRKQLPRPPRPSSSAGGVTKKPAEDAQSKSLLSSTSSDHGNKHRTGISVDTGNRLPHSVNNGGPYKQHTAHALESDVDMVSTETPLTSLAAEDHTEAETIVDSEVDELQAAALDFLSQYIKVFDEDRSDLASAYSHSALFSYRVHELDPASTTTPSRSGAFASKLVFNDTSGSGGGLSVKQSRLEIVTALLSLGSHKFCARGCANIEYDFAYLDPSNDVLLICYAEIADIQEGHRLSVDQSFILRKKERDEEDRLSDGLWPLVAVSHQMTIRDMSQRPTQKTNGASV